MRERLGCWQAQFVNPENTRLEPHRRRSLRQERWEAAALRDDHAEFIDGERWAEQVALRDGAAHATSMSRSVCCSTPSATTRTPNSEPSLITASTITRSPRCAPTGNEAPVDLDLRQRKALEIAQAGVAGSKIVDRSPIPSSRSP